MALKPDDRLFLGFEPAPQPFTGRLDDPIIGRNELDLAFKNLGEDVQTTFEREIERICAERREKLELVVETLKAVVQRLEPVTQKLAPVERTLEPIAQMLPRVERWRTRVLNSLLAVGRA